LNARNEIGEGLERTQTGAICRSQLDSSIVAMMPTARHIRAVVLAYALAHGLDYGSMF